ncbi:hypothetical protein BDR26DRAFT_252624 [Obelidium mucronatum]|nr:hypothetical protein BDR26DRAFT_252624 [Obelidium mucronatum]
MSYFLIVSLVICGIYENSYFLIATVFDTEEDPEYDVVTGKRLVHENVKVQRVALVRCILMSIGLVIFYIPSIILMFVTAFNHDLLYTISINQTLLFCITLIPAFDPLWSPIMILLFQQEFKEAFVEAFKSLWRRCWPSSSQKQVL